jgi:hypothetical protein
LVRERCGGDSPGGEAERQGRRSGRGEAVGRSARSVVAWRGVEAEEEEEEQEPRWEEFVPRR